MADTPEVEAPEEREGMFKAFFKEMMSLEQRQLLGTLAFFAIILLVGWVGLNEPRRMENFTDQYDGRSISRGADIFLNNCASCHGRDGRGLPGVAPALNDPALFNGERLAEIGWTGTLYDYVELTVAAGRPAMAGDWPQPMPTWSQEYGGPMRPDQVADVTNYVMNYGGFYAEDYEGPAVGEVVEPEVIEEEAFEPIGQDLESELPPGDPVVGEALFDGTQPGPDGGVLACNSCHSVDGSVLVGPTMQGIASRELPAGYDSVELYLRESILIPDAHIVAGFEGIQMPQNFGDRLDAQSLADLIAYLLTVE